jgi:chromosome segregation ATPase
MENQDRWLQRISRKLDDISLAINKLTQDEEHNMSAQDDIKQALQGITDTQDGIQQEADAIAVGIKAIRDAQAEGNQAAVEQALSDLSANVATLKQHSDTAKSHLDTANAALTDVPSDTPPST